MNLRQILARTRDPVLPIAVNAAPAVGPSRIEALSMLWRAATTEGWEPIAGADAVGTVDRCLQLTSQQIASMALRYRHAADVIGYEPAWVSDPDPAWYPNGIGDAIFSLVWSIYARGEGFLWVTSRYSNGYPRTFTVLDAITMEVSGRAGERVYKSNGTPLKTEDVIQVFRNPTGALRGRSVLDAYWSNILSARQAEAYAADVYGSTGVNRVALKSSRRLSAEQAADVQAQWVEAVSRRLGAPAILPPDLELLESITTSPKDLLLLDSREWDARQIAAAFGVPAMLLNIAISGGLAYQNPTQLFGLWWRSELMPAAKKIAAALSRWLPRGHWVEFDPGGSIAPDLETLVSVHSQALADGVISPDEYRAAVFDLPPLAVGDQGEDLYEEAGSHGAPTDAPTSPDAHPEVLGV